MIKDFREYIAENHLANDSDNILLAVSGGIDSMVMASLFLEAGYKTGIAHCNFSLRGKESDKDEELVSRFASIHNIPFYTTKFDTTDYARLKGISIQMAARELRYEWFKKIMAENNYDHLAIAHNLNDNIETLLINLTRGTGITGLTGMKPASEKIIRPLLFATREEIEKYCIDHNIEYREDRSNAETKYTRNKIRHKIIPVLQEINPSILHTLAETSGRMSDINEIVKSFISGIKDKICTIEGNNILFDMEQLRLYANNRSIIFELFKIYGIGNENLHDLINVINGQTGCQIFTGSHRILNNRKELIVAPAENEVITDYVVNNIEGFKTIPQIEKASIIDKDENFIISADSSIACIDSESISFPFRIRMWREGDVFQPLGMKHHKKLSDYFIDRKYSLIEKESKMVLESLGQIVWIIGDRLDDRFKITATTRKILRIQSKKA
jgi:tRNA(Ile)-lysidine synthase